MYTLTKNGFTRLSDTEDKRVFTEIYEKNDKNYHYLSFDRQLRGFCPIDCFLGHAKPELLKEERKVIETLLKRKEVCAFPDIKLSLYPLDEIDGYDYYLDFNNIEKHFKDLLTLNDEIYNTPYLYVYLGHGASNFDGELLKKYLTDLLSKSKKLKIIYTDSEF